MFLASICIICVIASKSFLTSGLKLSQRAHESTCSQYVALTSIRHHIEVMCLLGTEPIHKYLSMQTVGRYVCTFTAKFAFILVQDCFYITVNPDISTQ